MAYVGIRPEPFVPTLPTGPEVEPPEPEAVKFAVEPRYAPPEKKEGAKEGGESLTGEEFTAEIRKAWEAGGQRLGIFAVRSGMTLEEIREVGKGRAHIAVNDDGYVFTMGESAAKGGKAGESGSSATSGKAASATSAPVSSNVGSPSRTPDHTSHTHSEHSHSTHAKKK